MLQNEDEELYIDRRSYGAYDCSLRRKKQNAHPPEFAGVKITNCSDENIKLKINLYKGIDVINVHLMFEIKIVFSLPWQRFWFPFTK